MWRVTKSAKFEDPKEHLLVSGPIWTGQERVQELKNIKLSKQLYDEIHRRT